MTMDCLVIQSPNSTQELELDRFVVVVLIKIVGISYVTYQIGVRIGIVVKK